VVTRAENTAQKTSLLARLSAGVGAEPRYDGVVQSAFGRMLTYARADKTRPTENFTTEVLAAAIQTDPTPFLICLAGYGLVHSADDVASVDCRTQSGFPGAGIIDLILDVAEPPAFTSVWIEVKVDAPESGRQIDAYREYLALHPDATRPVLLTLGPRPLRNDVDLIWISWQSVWRSVHEATPTSPYWRDFALLLEELGMADRDDEPVAARESAALGDAFALFKKVRRALVNVGKEAQHRWSRLGFATSDGAIGRELLASFQRQGRLFVKVGTSSEAYLLLGIEPRDGESYASFWVETSRQSTALRGQIISVANDAGLPASWERRFSEWGGLQASARLVTLPSSQAVSDWYLRCLDELDASGVLSVVPGIGGNGALSSVDAK
jgi:hypothetical protein